MQEHRVAMDNQDQPDLPAHPVPLELRDRREISARKDHKEDRERQGTLDSLVQPDQLGHQDR
jgi:hypothetical protein